MEESSIPIKKEVSTTSTAVTTGTKAIDPILLKVTKTGLMNSFFNLILFFNYCF